jgi:hypothetical protein
MYFFFNLKIGFIDMFRVLRHQNENKIAEFLTEKFFGSKSNLTNRALVSLNLDSRLNFLDTTIISNNSQLNLEHYRKPTATDCMIN